MTASPDLAHLLLDRINSGQAAAAIPDIQALLQTNPGHLALLTLLAEAYRLDGQVGEAITAYRRAGEAGGGEP